MDGLGVLIYPYGEKSVVGEWKNGKEWNTKHTKKDGEKNGQGTFTFSWGEKYVREWKNGEKWNGTQYDKDGNITKKYVNGVRQ